MKIKINRTSIISVIGVVAAFLFVWLLLGGSSGDQVVDRTDGLVQYASGAAAVNISNLTGNLGSYGPQDEVDYGFEVGHQEFSTLGFYFEDRFLTTYLDTFGNIRMNVSSRMKPGDGVPSMYITPLYRPDQKVLEARVFVDQDMFDFIEGPITAHWDRGLEQSSQIELQEAVDGIYTATFGQMPFNRTTSTNHYVWAVGNQTGNPLNPPFDGIAVYAR